MKRCPKTAEYDDCKRLAKKLRYLCEKNIQFKIEKLIHRSYISTVFLAKKIYIDDESGKKKTKQVVIKIPNISKNSPNSRSLTEMTINEIQKLSELKRSRLKTPEIDSVIVGEDLSEIYIVMNYIDGIDLEKFFGNPRVINNMTLQTAVIFAISILRPVMELHKEGYLYRDLKPGNIMIEHGDFRLIDYGTTKETDKTHGNNTLVGTPYYAAPEQMNGVVNERSDVYAVSIMLMEMIAHKRINLLYKDRFKPINSILKHKIPNELADIIDTAKAYKYENRYESAEKFQLMLAKFLYNYYPEYQEKIVNYFARNKESLQFFEGDTSIDNKKLDKTNLDSQLHLPTAVDVSQEKNEKKPAKSDSEMSKTETKKKIVGKYTMSANRLLLPAAIVSSLAALLCLTFNDAIRMLMLICSVYWMLNLRIGNIKIKSQLNIVYLGILSLIMSYSMLAFQIDILLHLSAFVVVILINLMAAKISRVIYNHLVKKRGDFFNIKY